MATSGQHWGFNSGTLSSSPNHYKSFVDVQKSKGEICKTELYQQASKISNFCLGFNIWKYITDITLSMA